MRKNRLEPRGVLLYRVATFFWKKFVRLFLTLSGFVAKPAEPSWPFRLNAITLTGLKENVNYFVNCSHEKISIRCEPSVRRLAVWHIVELSNYFIAELPHRHIGTLAHWHIVELSHCQILCSCHFFPYLRYSITHSR